LAAAGFFAWEDTNPTRLVGVETSRGRAPTTSRPGSFISLKKVNPISTWPLAAVAIAAYFSTSGFAFDPGYFTNSGVDSPPLHALRSGVDGANGVYTYGSTQQFPSLTAAGSNYWADVAFALQ